MTCKNNAKAQCWSGRKKFNKIAGIKSDKTACVYAVIADFCSLIFDKITKSSFKCKWQYLTFITIVGIKGK